MLSAILAEAEAFAPREPATVFLGGGTPSLLSGDQLRRFLDGLDRLTGFRGSAVEVTAECNPESLDRHKAKCLLDLGVRRLSIGFQSLDDAVLERFGRVHTVEDSFRAFEAARVAGVPEINVDLIYAYPGQTAAQWDADLARVLSLSPDHVSAYNLTFEEETPFRRWLDQGILAKASEDLELELFDRVRARLRGAGFEAYEISNYARGEKRCAHNVNYWRNGAYLGIGPSAVSRLGDGGSLDAPYVRRGNVKSIQGYVQRVREQGHAVQWEERLDAAARLGETWWLGLRLAEGVDPERARRVAGFANPDGGDPALDTARRLEGQGLLLLRDGRFVLSERGTPLADFVGREFLEVAR